MYDFLLAACVLLPCYFAGMLGKYKDGAVQGGHMRLLVYLLLSCAPLLLATYTDAAEKKEEVIVVSGQDIKAFPAENQYCLACHQGIEPTRPLQSGMMQAIFARGRELGDPNGCVVCHAGTPAEIKNKDVAHSGAPAGSPLKSFTATPGALQLNDATCGQCHADHVYAVTRSHMNTDAGKMKAITWSWGLGTDTHDHVFGDHDLDDPDGMAPRLGTDAYKAYMADLARRFPGQFPQKLQQIPEVDVAKLAEQPEQAAYTYLRNCNACHLSGKGYQDRGHFRGVGCAACHSLYSNEGYYEGGDKALPKDKPGHVMTHAMQGTRHSVATVNGHTLSGIQVNTCAACHAAGRRIGHAYQGLMAFGHGDHRGPFDAKGEAQKTNGGYVFKYIREDVHFALKDVNGVSAGLLCQDCHLSTSMHGNGNIGATTLATIEVECADCHGTPDKYPWELPLGYGDEFGKALDWSKPRGVSREAMKVTRDFAHTSDAEDGYLLSARGNPFGNVVRRGDKVIVHSANGHDFELTPLKGLHQTNAWASPARAVTAMAGVARHMEKLECYACHSTWAAQYYGYQYALDYRQRSVDWLKTAEQRLPDGGPADRKGQMSDQPGAPTSWDYSHVRWENPPLGVNGEGRVTPLVGVIQTVGTVIGPDGTTLAWNKVAKTKAGHNAMELAPLNPHTSSRESRDCADCHGNAAAMGYGIDGGRYGQQPEKVRYADVRTPDGHNVSRFTQPQLQAIKGLHGDFMQALRTDGTQVQTVDSHWPGSMPLTPAQRKALERGGTCLACHQDIPQGAVPIAMLGKMAEVLDLDFAAPQAHADLLRENNILVSWVKALAIVAAVLLLPALVWFIRWRRGRRR